MVEILQPALLKTQYDLKELLSSSILDIAACNMPEFMNPTANPEDVMFKALSGRNEVAPSHQSFYGHMILWYSRCLSGHRWCKAQCH